AQAGRTARCTTSNADVHRRRLPSAYCRAAGERDQRRGSRARRRHRTHPALQCTGALPGKSGDPSFDSLVAALEAGRGLTAKPSWATHDPATHRLRRLSKELPEPLPPAQWFTRSFGHVWQLVPGANWTYLKGAETKDRQASVD